MQIEENDLINFLIYLLINWRRENIFRSEKCKFLLVKAHLTYVYCSSATFRINHGNQSSSFDRLLIHRFCRISSHRDIRRIGSPSGFPAAFICIWCQRSCTYEICFWGRDKNTGHRKIHTVENCVRLKGWSTTTSFGIVVSCSHPHNDCPSFYVHHGRSKPADWTFLSTRCSTPPGQWNEKQFDGLPYSLLSPPLCLRCIGPWLRVKKLSFILNFSLSPSFLSPTNLISFRGVVHRTFYDLLLNICNWRGNIEIL